MKEMGGFPHQSMVMCACNPKVCEGKAGILLQTWSLSGLHSDFKGTFSCIMNACLKRKLNKKNQ